MLMLPIRITMLILSRPVGLLLHLTVVAVCVGESSSLVSALAPIAFSQPLVKGLDLETLFQEVGRHCGTYRGRQALLDHCYSRRSPAPAAANNRRQTDARSSSTVLSPVAQTAAQVEAMSALVQEAMDLLTQKQEQPDWPPMYATGPIDTREVVTTDDDEWLHTTTDPTELGLLDIWQAEQVVRRILQVFRWLDCHPSFHHHCTEQESTATPQQIVTALEDLYKTLQGTVRVQRVQLSADPRATLQVTLDASKFTILRILDKRNDNTKEALVEAQREIQMSLARALLRHTYEIDHGLNVLARLDVIFAKAAFGVRHHGRIANVAHDGSLCVHNFRHPLLSDHCVVANDLLLGGTYSSPLVISGPNGGGKSLALKSFGLAAVMLKLAIPFGGEGSCWVPFYDDIEIALGDPQDIAAAQSTFTAKLQQCSSILQRVIAENKDETKQMSALVLWDELLSGTDDAAGAVIGQAILEELMDCSKICHCVATTHSPRLKEFSFHDPRIGCASVQLQGSLPSFKLHYGSIGQSVPFHAIRRVQPPFSDRFLQRLTTTTTNLDDEEAADEAAYVQALTLSLERQVEETKEATAEVAQLRNAMVQLALTYEKDIDRLGVKLERTYALFLEKREKNELDDFELVGKSMAEVALVRKRVQSESDLLASRGLKRLGDDHQLNVGDNVVVIDETSAWQGATGLVKATAAALGGESISVEFPGWSTDSLDTGVFVLHDEFDVHTESIHTFERRQLGIWDYDSIWDDEKTPIAAAPSMEKSKRDVHQLLGSLATKLPDNNKLPQDNNKTFLSSRSRKAAKKRKRRR